ncbi:MAG: hypothetical protein ACJA0X_000784 [Cyclobacteriaceae bacterium]|jgi:hypothetical protein
MRKIFSLFFISFCLYGCHDPLVERTFVINNSTSYNISLMSYKNGKIAVEGLSQGVGEVTRFFGELKGDGIGPYFVLGDSVNMIFSDSLILIHWTFANPDQTDTPAYERNILFNPAWTRISNELFTFEITNEMYEEAVPLED